MSKLRDVSSGLAGLPTTLGDQAIQRAFRAMNAGQWVEAEREARLVLARRPQDVGALSVLGCVSLGRNLPDQAIEFFGRAQATQPKDALLQFRLGEAHRSAGSLKKALRHYQKAAQLNRGFAEAHARAGEVLRTLGRSDDAAQAYRTALALKPDLPDCLNGLGLLLVRRGEFGQAASCFETALGALPTGLAEARAVVWANLGTARLDGGAVIEGLAALAEAIACSPEVRFPRLLAQHLLNARFVPQGARFRSTVLELIQRYDIDPRLLATAAIAILNQDPDIADLLHRLADDPGRAGPIINERRATVQSLLADELLRALLPAAPIPDVGLELLLTQLRRVCLMSLGAPSERDPALDLRFVSALARQCFLNEYVYFVDQLEIAALTAIRSDLGREGRESSADGWYRMAVLACYQALDGAALPVHDATNVPELLRPLVREQIEEPAEEWALRKALLTLEPIRDDVSLAVQRQYEENPYPRWTRCQIGAPRPLPEVVSAALPHLDAGELPTPDRPRILVAGCGTGLQTMHVVHTYADSSVLAIDLSRASLAYGLRKQKAYGAGSVRHLQADILDLGVLSERFDLIESFGVLHHMRDPQAGLRVLGGLLAPDGLMLLGLYSRLARASVVAGRDFITQRGLPANPDGIRAARRELMTTARPELADLLSPASDFWSLSECRDLIFHVEEHRFTLLEVGQLLKSCGLAFLGLELRRPLDRARFRAEHPGPAAARSLAVWHEFETRFPDTFGETYRIWARPD